MIRRLIDWIEHRTGLETLTKEFLYEEIPGSSGWHQIFGSVAIFAFLIQVVTGILLAVNYAPTPGEAYNSLKYILTELTAGRMIRGLHHWGASMMIVIVVLHMCQVFLYGGYKKPREATWMAGVVLLLLTMAYGLTGYLLPWDQRAYWGTVVATQIAGSAPVLGPYMARLLGSGEGGIGVVTFARFYAIHVLLLPPATTLLIGFHVYLVRKHGVAPAPVETKPKKKFYPEQVFMDTMGVFVYFAILFAIAATVRVPLERLADPTDTAYIPRPEWYFLFLFQTLKFFEGSAEVVGTVVLPTLAVVALFLVPFIDRSTPQWLRQRRIAVAVMAFAVVGWSSLTIAAIRSTPAQRNPEVDLDAGPVQNWQELTPQELAGISYYRRESCNTCHGPDQKNGPDLTSVRAVHKNAAWMIEHFQRPAQMVPGTSMPPLTLTRAQLNSLAAFLLKLNPKNAKDIDSAPEFAVEGAALYQQNNCSVCHMVNGTGMKTGPPLNGVGQRRSREWIVQHFLDPQKLSPGTPMPVYKFNSKDMDRITSYLLALP